MKKLLKISLNIIILLASANISKSQDLDIFNKHLNDNFDIPKINPNMTFQEYQLLSRNLRMKDMLYAMIVPGYTHFYVHENKLGYSMLATRMAGYGGLGYVWLKNNDRINFKSLLLKQFNKNIFPEEDRNKYTAITSISLTLIFGSYLFDWIHGQYQLKKKQEEIRFKYSPHLISGIFYPKTLLNENFAKPIPTFGISFNF